MASTKMLIQEMLDIMRGTGLRAADLAEGSLRYATFNWADYMADRTIDPWAEPEWVEWIQPKRLPTNCKNCGAPLHGSRCEYCDTEY